MKYFSSLAESLIACRDEFRTNKNAFADIAAKTLDSHSSTHTLQLNELYDSLAQAESLPHQTPVAFGEPSIEVYRDEDFVIQVLFWVESTTFVHSHGFSGAFQVLHGESLQASYEFTAHAEIDPTILIGKLVCTQLKSLRLGDIECIVPGADFIHAICHLGKPSVTVLIRSDFEFPEPVIPRIHLSPSIAYDSDFLPGVFKRQLEVLALLAKTDLDLYAKFAGQLIERKNANLIFRVLRHAHDFMGEAPFDSLMEQARIVRPDLVDALVPALQERRRREDLHMRRWVYNHEDHRFLLGLLTHAPNRKSIYQAVHARNPAEDSQLLVMRWLKEMGEVTCREHPELAIDLEPAELEILADMMAGKSIKTIGESVLQKPGADITERQLRSTYLSLLSFGPFKPLFISGECS